MVWKALYKRTQQYWVLFYLSILFAARYISMVYCDFLFIVETELFIIAFHNAKSNKIISSLRESFMP